MVTIASNAILTRKARHIQSELSAALRAYEYSSKKTPHQNENKRDVENLANFSML